MINRFMEILDQVVANDRIPLNNIEISHHLLDVESSGMKEDLVGFMTDIGKV